MGTPRPGRTWPLAALLASLAMLGVFSVDTYLPAFPAIARDLDTTALAMQQTLSAYLVAYAFMMLWLGALSDALGRRPVILAGLLVYAIATLGCAIAGNIESLWLFRTLQGLSSGAGLVVGRAIIRDRFHGPDAQRLMSQVTMMFAAAPALAPIVGGVLLELAGWRSIFWVLFAIVLLLLAWTVRRLPESLPRAQRQRLSPRTLWHNYRNVATRPAFLLLACVSTFNFAAFFIYIASAPAFLLDLLGVTTLGFAWLFAPMIGGIMIGAFISGRLAGRHSPHGTIRLGYAVAFTGVVLNLLVCHVLPPRPLWNVAPIMLFTTGTSIIMPSVTLLMLDLFPRTRGLASSLQGFVQFTLAAFSAAVIAPALAHSVAALAAGMAGFAVAGAGAWTLYVLHVRKPASVVSP